MKLNLLKSLCEFFKILHSRLKVLNFLDDFWLKMRVYFRGRILTDIMFAFDLFAGVISLLEHNEDYVITFPSTYCRCVFLRYFNFRSDCIWKTVRGANG